MLSIGCGCLRASSIAGLVASVGPGASTGIAHCSGSGAAGSAPTLGMRWLVLMPGGPAAGTAAPAAAMAAAPGEPPRTTAAAAPPTSGLASPAVAAAAAAGGGGGGGGGGAAAAACVAADGCPAAQAAVGLATCAALGTGVEVAEESLTWLACTEPLA